MSESTSAGGTKRKLLVGCGVVSLLAVVLPIGGWWAYSYQAEQARLVALEQQELAANEQFTPALDAMTVPAEQTYDIDQTIRVIHEIDLAMQEKGSLEEYLRWSASQDYRDVAPEVLEKRKEILDVLMRLYAKQAEADDQEAMWDITSELMLKTLSVVGFTGEASLTNPAAGVKVDRAQAEKLLQEMKDEKAEHKQLMRDITSLETELFDHLVSYGEVYYKYVSEWDQLSVLRDRAYLAAHNGDWEATLAAADLAIAKAPQEREAHLLKAMALIEQDDRENTGQIEALLGTYIDEHPDASAPAFVLMGVHQAKQGKTREAQLAFQQSAAYFPKQSDTLTDMVDPYKMRSFLRKSREGSFIVELYQSTMLGAGYFSPDLQLAKVLFDKGDRDGGRAKVLDHFARRRNQQQWNFLVSDIAFCHDLLGPDFWEIFPEETYLDLEVSNTMMGSALNLSVNNRSERVLHNATLVLALQFTDMYAGDYEVLPAAETVPAVLAKDDTSFGSLTIELDVNGKPKTVTDIVHHRAILIADEAVSWVDTDAFRLAEDKAFREQMKTRVALSQTPEPEPPKHPIAQRHPEFQGTVDTLIEGVSEVAQVQMESKYGSDNLLITVPKELSILRPAFRLRYGDKLYEAQDNLIEGDQIQLRFAGVGNLDADDAPAPDDVELLMGSPFGDVVFGWKNNGDLTWRFAATEKAP